MMVVPSKVGPVSGCIVASSCSAMQSPPVRNTTNLFPAIRTPKTCALERPVHHGLDSDYVVVSSGSTTPSPPGSTVQNLYIGVPFAMNLFIVVMCADMVDLPRS